MYIGEGAADPYPGIGHPPADLGYDMILDYHLDQPDRHLR
jgi:hypothetical protein